MPAFQIEPFQGRPLLDIGSYARPGPGRRNRLSPAQIAQIARTVGRAPEVMVKVLTRNSTDAASVARHVGYIGRRGDLELETDDGERVSGRAVGQQLLDDWNLVLEEYRRGDDLTAGEARKPAKLVHKLIFSMPPGTPPAAVLNASRNFLREEFAHKHRYALVLHTDEPHPHVHAVVKAVSEQGERLHIRKATLRRWRAEFARHLRAQGVAANATERAVRGQVIGSTLDPIYRAMKDPRRGSTHVHAKQKQVATTTARQEQIDPHDSTGLRATRTVVRNGWHAIAQWFQQESQPALAAAVLSFVQRMPAPLTDRQQMQKELLATARERPQERARGR